MINSVIWIRLSLPTFFYIPGMSKLIYMGNNISAHEICQSFSQKIKIIGVINRNPGKIEKPSTDSDSQIFVNILGFQSMSLINIILEFKTILEIIVNFSKDLKHFFFAWGFLGQKVLQKYINKILKIFCYMTYNANLFFWIKRIQK